MSRLREALMIACAIGFVGSIAFAVATYYSQVESVSVRTVVNGGHDYVVVVTAHGVAMVHSASCPAHRGKP